MKNVLAAVLAVLFLCGQPGPGCCLGADRLAEGLAFEPLQAAITGNKAEGLLPVIAVNQADGLSADLDDE